MSTAVRKMIDNRSKIEMEFGPDPLILKKKGQARNISDKYESYKKKINDPTYLEFAIDKIALELTHFLWL